jgi:hypothetical protein
MIHFAVFVILSLIKSWQTKSVGVGVPSFLVVLDDPTVVLGWGFIFKYNYVSNKKAKLTTKNMN